MRRAAQTRTICRSAKRSWGASQFCECGGRSPPHSQNWVFNLQKWDAPAPANGARSEPLRDGVPFVQDARNTKSSAQLVYSYINALTSKTDLSLVRLRPYLSLVLDGRGEDIGEVETLSRLGDYINSAIWVRAAFTGCVEDLIDESTQERIIGCQS